MYISKLEKITSFVLTSFSDNFDAVMQAAMFTCLFVTGPAKTGHVGTNYTMSIQRSHLSVGTEYLCSVICIVMLNKCILST